MIHILSQPERQKVREAWSDHPLFIVCDTAFYDREVHFDAAEITSEDIFYATATILDELKSSDELRQKDIKKLWQKLYKVIREAKPDATEHDKRQVAHTVFAIARKALCHHWRTLYRETYFEMLGKTIDDETKTADTEEKDSFVEQLIRDSSALADWITDYEGHLSEKIEASIGTHNDDIPNNIFHDNLDESKIASTLAKIDRKECGPKQFTYVAKSFFEEIGWLNNRIDTAFVSWMKGKNIVTMQATGLTHVDLSDKTEKLKTCLQNTFQMLNGRQKWEDRNEFYKFNRQKINKG